MRIRIHFKISSKKIPRTIYAVGCDIVQLVIFFKELRYICHNGCMSWRAKYFIYNINVQSGARNGWLKMICRLSFTWIHQFLSSLVRAPHLNLMNNFMRNIFQFHLSFSFHSLCEYFLVWIFTASLPNVIYVLKKSEIFLKLYFMCELHKWYLPFPLNYLFL